MNDCFYLYSFFFFCFKQIISCNSPNFKHLKKKIFKMTAFYTVLVVVLFYFFKTEFPFFFTSKQWHCYCCWYYNFHRHSYNYCFAWSLANSFDSWNNWVMLPNPLIFLVVCVVDSVSDRNLALNCVDACHHLVKVHL